VEWTHSCPPQVTVPKNYWSSGPVCPPGDLLAPTPLLVYLPDCSLFPYLSPLGLSHNLLCCLSCAFISPFPIARTDRQARLSPRINIAMGWRSLSIVSRTTPLIGNSLSSPFWCGEVFFFERCPIVPYFLVLPLDPRKVSPFDYISRKALPVFGLCTLSFAPLFLGALRLAPPHRHISSPSVDTMQSSGKCCEDTYPPLFPAVPPFSPDRVIYLFFFFYPSPDMSAP